jgi:hypothetical protein
MNSSGNSIGSELGQLFNDIHKIQCEGCEYKKSALKTEEVQKPAHNKQSTPCAHGCDNVVPHAKCKYCGEWFPLTK